jgi:carbamoyltransferase
MTKPVLDQVILGINDSHDASACLVRGGRILCAVSEERLQRVKSAGGFPANAIKACLDAAGLSPADIDHVALAGTRAVPVNMIGTLSTFTIEDHLKLQEQKRRAKFYENRNVPFAEVFPDFRPKANPHYPLDRLPFKDTAEMSREEKIRVQDLRLGFIADATGVPRERIRRIDHHTCHAYYAYYASPWRNERVTALTLDGGGDGVYDSVNVFGPDGAFERLHASHECLIGKMYSMITLALGMRPNEEEYKVMGLAPYAREHKKKGPREILLDYMTLDGVAFKRNPAIRDLFFHTRDLMRQYRFDGIAGGLQDFAEHFLVRWVKAAVALTGAGKVVFAGGVAQNVKANMLLAALDCVDGFFVPPGAGDESLSIGAAWALMDELAPDGAHRARVAPMEHGYLGPDFGPADVAAFADHPAVRARYRRLDGEAKQLAAEALARNEIVAVCRGRMEFGPRALGHRSILGNPARAETVEKINHAIKGRDFWMPFAPSVLAEEIDRYLRGIDGAELRFMTCCLESRDAGRAALTAGLHPKDKTARVHAVYKEHAPDYYDIIARFREKSGVGGVLNTSLNIHGKPIVNKPADLAEELLVHDWVDIDGILVGDTFWAKTA